MAGLFYNPNTGGFSLGGAGTVGGIGPGPVGQGNGSQGYVPGGALQGGFGLIFGNAVSAQSLSGGSTTYSGDIRLAGCGIGGSFSQGAGGIWQFTINLPVFKPGLSLHFSKVKSYMANALTFGEGCHG